MEKRSRRRTRDLVAQAASQGLSENEIGCARISMMTRSKNAPFKGRIQKRKTLSLRCSFRLATHGRSPDSCTAANSELANKIEASQKAMITIRNIHPSICKRDQSVSRGADDAPPRASRTIEAN